MKTLDSRQDDQIVDEIHAAFAGGEIDGTGPLRTRLSDRADEEGLLDVAYRTVDSPFGPLLVAATPRGVVRIAFDSEGHSSVLGRLAAQVSPRVLLAPRRLEVIARQLAAYFAGRLRAFDVPVDLQLAQGFRRTVLDHLRDIPYGATESYAAVAAAAGRPSAVRAAGGACSNNPIPLVVPCHRVVRSDGTIGQYRGGSKAKEILLALERA
ncbi:MAG TPA: methylated-DNA--[protein]-cysteine S-methyltransferase [Acidimicrobiales bacterium]|jgi:methylated-DNA-[protein]-cysteine S-methyltransferase|nr:methylated-DNA--[protein]-cysteine S-methyltransferase [Acidimicrobiales bacterium]